jgi:hypothetical protein
MTDVERLLALEDIRKLKAAYFRCMDTKRRDELADLFTEDAVFDTRGALEMPKPEAEYEAEPVLTGRALIANYITNGLAPMASVHHGHMPEIEILSANEANGVWAMDDLLVPADGVPFRTFRGYGYYRETYRRTDRWRIATLKLRRFYVEIV